MPESQLRQLTVNNVAQFCEVNAHTVDVWLQDGRLKSEFDGRERKVNPTELMHFMHLHHMAIPMELLSEIEQTTVDNVLKVLIVDHDKATVTAISTVLKELNLQVLVASNGFDASITYIKRKPQLLTLDLSLNDMNGIELIQNIKSTAQQETKILVIANSIPSLMEKAKTAGADAVISKPFDNDSLKRTVKILLNLR